MKSLALLCLLAPALRAAPAALPDPQGLLDSVLEPPRVGYEGRMMVTHWFGRQAQAEEIEVYHSPPDHSRREFLDPDGTIERVVVSDGDNEQVQVVRQGKVFKGDAVKRFEKLMPPEQEKSLLLKNYQVSVIREDQVAGRKASILELKPVVAGKPLQRLWIDRETGVVLENKRFLPKRSFAALSRFSRFETKKDLDPALFELFQGSTAARASASLEPDFLTLDELAAATGKAVPFPTELPGGFVFESADYFEANKAMVRQARYTDGLAVVSLFATDKPVRLPKGGTMTVAAPATGKGASGLRLSSAGKVLSWKRGGVHYTLVADLSRELLESMSAGLKQR